MNVMTVTALSREIREKKVSARETLSEYKKRCEAENPRLNALNSVYFEAAEERAKEIDERIARGENAGKLAGVPIVVKDNICIEGMKCTCSSKSLENFVPPYTATAASRLLKEGAIVIGKANLDEFGIGSHAKTDGCAAAVAAGLAPAALGSDTGGELRSPASAFGLFGLRPTYGAVSRFGLSAYASSFDQIGVVATSAEDCALIMDVIGGHDPRDMRSAAEKPDYTGYKSLNLNGLKISAFKDYAGPDKEWKPVSGKVLSEYEKALNAAADLKMLCAEIKPRSFKYAPEAYHTIACAEAASGLARIDGVKYGFRAENVKDVTDIYYESRTQGFGAEVKKRVMLGNHVLTGKNYAEYFLKAQEIRTAVCREFEEIFSDADILLTPVCGFSEETFMILPALAGYPAITVPIPVGKSGGMTGVQLIAKEFNEPLLFAAAEALAAALEKEGK